MKILYHHRTASKDGQAVHIEELIDALRQQGHLVRVVAPAAAADDRLGSEVGWVQRLRQHLPKALYELLELAYSLVAYRRLAQAAREFQPDVIYERYNLYLLSGLMLKWRFKLPLLLEVNAPLVEERMKFGGLGLPWLGHWAESLVWRGADVVLPVTRVLADKVLARGVAPQHVVVIPNGINEEHFAAAPSCGEAKQALGWPDALILGFTGFVRDWHGVDKVLRWLAQGQSPANACVLVVGDGPARAELEQLARELGIAHRVRFTGVVPRARVPQHVAAFDVALQPASVAYASPLKLFEYLAMGKAIVAPQQANIAEVLNDGRNALLFDAQVDGSLEAALTRLCADTALRQQLGAAAKATIAEQGLTWLRNAQRVAYLAQALHEGRAATEPRPDGVPL
jgi:glycosyltransferase involved in cell wall biosynthesis